MSHVCGLLGAAFVLVGLYLLLGTGGFVLGVGVLLLLVSYSIYDVEGRNA